MTRPRSRRLIVVLVAVAAAAAIAAVTIDRIRSGATMQTFSQEQAYALVDQRIQDAVDQMTPRPELDDMEAPGPLHCEAGGLGSGGWLTERGYRLHGIPTDRNTEIFDTLHDYWKDNGYRITDDQRDRDRARILKARHKDDDFSIGLDESVQGDLFIGGSSPCVELTDPPR